MFAPWKESYDQTRQYIKKQRHYFANNGPSNQSYCFSSVRYGCESWTIKKAGCWRIDAFELWCWRRLFESPLDCKEIQPVNPKGSQSWIFIERTDAEAETPILWPPNEKNWFIGKDPNPGKDWRQEEKGMTEEEMASLTRWTWVWVSCGSWWWTGKPCVLQSIGLQRVGHDSVTGLNWTSGIFQSIEDEMKTIARLSGLE